MERAVIFGTCPQCDGTRLADPARTCFIDGRSTADACAMQISDLAQSSLIHGHLSPMDDVVTYRLVDSGRTIVVIEHHQALMEHADWIIEWAPEPVTTAVVSCSPEYRRRCWRIEQL